MNDFCVRKESGDQPNVHEVWEAFIDQASGGVDLGREFVQE
jgi:hypothetical protein